MEMKEKQSKMANLKYESMEIQNYLVDGNKNTKLSKLIFKARLLTLDIKLQKKWKYEDTICVGCDVSEESGDEILNCDGFNDGEQISNGMLYTIFFDGSSSEMAKIATVLRKN